jgi:hypothetical protein
VVHVRNGSESRFAWVRSCSEAAMRDGITWAFQKRGGSRKAESLRADYADGGARGRELTLVHTSCVRSKTRSSEGAELETVISNLMIVES